MLISKSKTGEGSIVTALLDTGTTACLISEKVARDQKLNIKETSHINLKGAGGEPMQVLGTTSLFLDLYEGSPRGQRQGSRKHIQAIVSPDLNNSEEVLINR